MASIVVYQGHYYAVGARSSSGYREFKSKDGYHNEVIGMVFIPLATVQKTVVHSSGVCRSSVQVSRTRTGQKDCIEVASFFIGDRWLGIKADLVLEAINPDGIATIPGAHSFVSGKVLYQGYPIPVVDIRQELRLPPKEFDADTQIVVARAGESKVGLVVDALGEIPEISLERVDASSGLLDNQDNYVECVVKPDAQAADSTLLVVLNPERLVRHLVKGKGLGTQGAH